MPASGRVYLWGYRMNEIRPISLPPAKSDLVISLNFRDAVQVSQRRVPLSTNLPLYVTTGSSSPLFQVYTPPRPDPADVYSTIGGIIKRFGYSPPPVNRTLRRQFIRFVDLWLKRNLKPLSDSDLPTFDEWIEGTPYSDARKRELKRVWDGCCRMPQWKKWRIVKSFIKDETYPEYKYPRLINSRVDTAKCFWGPYVAAISDQVFKNPWFIKNTPVADRPFAISERLEKPGATYICTDYTAFEAHFTPEVMSMIQDRLFTYMLKGCSTWTSVEKFLHDVLAGTNCCRFKFLTVKVKGVRMSGEMDTSLSNGFSNLMLFLFFCWKNGLETEGPRSQVRGFVEGDDGIFVVDQPQLAPTQEQFASLGFTIKIVTTKEFSEASFCGQVYDPDERVVVTDIVEAITRLGWTNKKYVNASEATLLQLLRAKGFSFYYQYNGCPVLAVLGRRILELTHNIKITDRIVNNMDGWEKEKYLASIRSDLPIFKVPGLGTRRLVEKLYGVTVRQQLVWEDLISTCDLGPLNLPGLEVPEDWDDFGSRYSSITTQDPVWLVKPTVLYVHRLVEAHPPLGEHARLSGVKRCVLL